ncbi:transducin beta-like protein 3 isoform X2 [Clytia hemisphaerica]|uniref:U3 small nucleolar RNA-associated protein 13 C-terminal domain-containing protein n=1 Tax=Clytia hemisphaerica TaxID=252671 RepID=A0A7M5X4J0_9CNID
MANFLKTDFELEKSFESFYTGGTVQTSNDGSKIFCSCNDVVCVISVKTGEKLFSLKDDGDEITCFAVSPDGKTLVTATKALLMHSFDLESQTLKNRWKVAHKTPVLAMTIDASSTLLASGSSDTTVKVYDLDKQYYTHSFKGSEESVSLVQFHPSTSKMQLFSSSTNGKIRLWDLTTSKCVSIFEGHYSEVTSIIILTDGSTMVSSGRDKVFIIWDLGQRKQIKTVPVYECVESLCLLKKNQIIEKANMSEDNEYFISVGEQETLKVWTLPECRNVLMNKKPKKLKENDDTRNPSLYSKIYYCEATNELLTVTLDQNLVFYNLDTLKLSKQFIGHFDDVLDIQYFGTEEKYITIATNSEQIKVINTESGSAEVLHGHTGTVLSVSISTDGNYIASCSKDNTIRIWCVNEETGKFCCIAVGSGHTHDIGAICWSRTNSDYLITGSTDLTVKCWNLPELLIKSETIKLTAKWTQKLHDKDINSVAVAPNDKFIVSASQDKTAKVSKLKSGEQIGVLRGHKRGIWCVRFSPIDKCIVTASADSTIKLWALNNFTCVKTFEGHNNSVLKVEFLSKGMQLLSTGSDGLLKIWDIKNNECLTTIDGHEEKTWALAIKKTEDFMVTGGEDSTIKIWMDITEKLKLEEEEKVHSKMEAEQELQNLLQQKKYTKAIGLAIRLEQPFRALNMFKDLLMEEEALEKIDQIVKGLKEYQVESLLDFICDWNTNAKHSFASQTVLSIILKTRTPDELLGYPRIKEILEALLPYTERHFDRMNNLVQQTHFVNYTWESMKMSSIE